MSKKRTLKLSKVPIAAFDAYTSCICLKMVRIIIDIEGDGSEINGESDRIKGDNVRPEYYSARPEVELEIRTGSRRYMRISFLKLR